jgi:hypothetical protein
MACPWEKYNDIFGVPRNGIHSYRFLDTAIVDYTLAITLAMTVTYITGVPLELTTIIVLI